MDNKRSRLVIEDKSWWEADRPWGFRFGFRDFLVVVSALVGVVLLFPYIGFYSMIIVIPLIHFFLFCNCFRLGAVRESIWILTFLINAFVHLTPEKFDWGLLLFIQSPITLFLIVSVVISKNYHGVGCLLINPDGYQEGAKNSSKLTKNFLVFLKVPSPIIEFLIEKKLKNFE